MKIVKFQKNQQKLFKVMFENERLILKIIARVL